MIIGSATSREYALARFLSYCNGSEISAYLWRDSVFVKKFCNNYQVGDVQDIDSIIKFVIKVKPSFVIITQGEAIQIGVRDHINSINIPCIAPTKDQSKLENSKSFCRTFVREIDEKLIPRYQVFNKENINDLVGYINQLNCNKIVLKFDGLMNSKGVKIYKLQNSLNKEIQDQAKFWITERNSKVIVEEYIEGDEVSLMSFVDGNNIVHMPPVRNYKRIWENDRGENTSGIGAVTTGKNLPFLNEKDLIKLHKINNSVFQKIRKYFDKKYIGILFGEFIVNNGEVKVIEYNTRFGNPSTINILNLLNTNFLEVCKSMVAGTLDQFSIKWKNLASISISVVPDGYPYSKKNVGEKISLKKLNEEEMSNIFFASLTIDNKGMTLMNSRNLTVCTIGDQIDDCRRRAVNILNKIDGPIYFRDDIGVFQHSSAN